MKTQSPSLHLIKFICLWLILFLQSNSLYNQSNPDANTGGVKMSYRELLLAILSCQDSIFTLSHANIYLEDAENVRFVRSKDTSTYRLLDTVVINVEVQLANITFQSKTDQNHLGFRKIKFKEPVQIELSTKSCFPRLMGCSFEKSFEFYGHEVSKDLSPHNNPFVINCNFLGPAILSTSTEKEMHLMNSTFSSLHRPDRDEAFRWIIYTTDENVTVRLSQNKFKGQEAYDQLFFALLNPYSLKLFDNIFDIDVSIHELSIQDITLRGNQFHKLIDLANIDFGYAKSEISFSEISNRIGAYANLIDTIWQPKTLEAFDDVVAKERFFSAYRRVTEYYRYRGNRKAFNASYTEMKDFETLSLEYDYRKESTLANWFSWRMNQFLGTFSNYGTMPVKAILYAIRVILYFSLLYFFFSNDWDFFTQGRLIAGIQFLSAYFRSDEGLADLYKKTTINSQKHENFLMDIQNNKETVPRVFSWVSIPLHWLATIKNNTINYFLNKLELMQGVWSELEKNAKRKAAIWVSIWILTYILVGLLMKAVNSLTLSINSFTTLGFGNIPTTGLPRYAAILEGFIGWFLLTIFSVSLITQLLQ